MERYKKIQGLTAEGLGVGNIGAPFEYVIRFGFIYDNPGPGAQTGPRWTSDLIGPLAYENLILQGISSSFSLYGVAAATGWPYGFYPHELVINVDIGVDLGFQHFMPAIPTGPAGTVPLYEGYPIRFQRPGLPVVADVFSGNPAIFSTGPNGVAGYEKTHPFMFKRNGFYFSVEPMPPDGFSIDPNQSVAFECVMTFMVKP